MINEALLKSLLQAEVLNEDTKSKLTEAIQQHVEEITEATRREVTASTIAELNERWAEETDALVEALDSRVTEVMASELDQFRGDVERFRDLEAEYATRIVSERERMAKQMERELSTLAEQMDASIDLKMVAELAELKESLLEARRNQFGRKMFEAFVEEFETANLAGDKKSLAAKLAESNKRYQDAMKALEESERRNAKMERTRKMQQVLAPLSGSSKDVMEAILKTVDTNMLEEAYSTYIGRVLKESATPAKKAPASEKENKVLAEGAKKVAPRGVLRTGDTVVTESAQEAEVKPQALSTEERARLRRQAGLV